ncbi:MAG: M20 family metallopeptidase, partial [Chitinophagales bacterium]|nr:M20 family metallopeptidase [Chitinophagales bacterium]
VLWLRADMDALPITEAPEKPCVSENPGVMHACGHDVHTTCLLGALYILKNLSAQWSGRVGFIFQPGEEVLPGGASLILKEGLLESFPSKGIIGLHVHPDLDAGQVALSPGPVMASSDELYIRIKGPGGHAALPHLVPDTLLAAAHLLITLQQEVSRRRPPLLPAVLSFGKMTGGTAPNVIPQWVELAGTLRCMDENWRRQAHKEITHIVESVAQSFDVKAECQILEGYPVLFNHPDLTQKVAKALSELLGADHVHPMQPRMTSEDFATYTRLMPGCFFRLGTGGPGSAHRHSVHTAQFDINPQSLMVGAASLAWAALYLADQEEAD